MKRMRRRLLNVALFLGLAIPTSVIAQQEERAADREPDEQGRDAGRMEAEARRDQEDVEDRARHRPAPVDARAEVRVRRQITQLTKLQTAMKEKLDLSREQEEAVDQLFQDYFRDLKDKKSRPKPFGANRGDREALTELRKKMTEAHKKGDNETLQKLRQELREKMRPRSSAVSGSMSQLFSQVANELDEEQRPRFRNLIRSLRIGSAPRAPGGELRTLWRAVMRPDNDLSEEQQKTARNLLRDGFKAIGEVESDDAKVKEITARVHADILAQLTAEQRVKVEAALEAEKKRGRGRWHDEARPSHRRSQRRPTHDDAGDQEEEEGEEPDDDQD